MKKALEPLRRQGYLTSYSESTEQWQQGPIIVVGTGETPFDLVQADTNERIIFFDAPLHNITDERYTREISPLASTDWATTVGWRGIFDADENIKRKIQEMISHVRFFLPRWCSQCLTTRLAHSQAHDKGIQTRFVSGELTTAETCAHCTCFECSGGNQRDRSLQETGCGVSQCDSDQRCYSDLCLFAETLIELGSDWINADDVQDASQL